MLNGLKFDRNGEEMAVTVFADSLRKAAQDFIDDPRALPLIPNWNRVLAAIPEFFDLLLDAVEKDSKQAMATAVA
jgi:glucosyl-3-phosphoglycerate synthase